MPEASKITEAQALLSESRFDEAKQMFSTIISEDPTISEAYLGRLLAELEMTSEEDLIASSTDVSENEDFCKAIAFADGERKKKFSEISESIAASKKILSIYDSDFLENIYRRATNPENTSESYSKNAEILRSISGYRDASALARQYARTAAELAEKEAEEKRIRDEKESAEREEKRKRSDSVQIKIYSVIIAVLSVFLIFLICYNTFLKDFIKKRQLLDEIYPTTYDELTVADEKSAPWFYVSDEGVLSFKKDEYEGDGIIVIPDVFENTLVRAIKENAFKDFVTLKSVKISDYVVEIGENAFSGCSSLESVTLPRSLTEIKAYCFYGCSSLREIVLPSYTESIDKGAFSGCSSLEELVFPEGLIYIGTYCFQNCSSIRSITLPKTVSNIGTRAFSECSAVEVVIYGGSEGDFEEITIGVDNGPFDKNAEGVRFEFSASK